MDLIRPEVLQAFLDVHIPVISQWSTVHSFRASRQPLFALWLAISFCICVWVLLGLCDVLEQEGNPKTMVFLGCDVV